MENLAQELLICLKNLNNSEQQTEKHHIACIPGECTKKCIFAQKVFSVEIEKAVKLTKRLQEYATNNIQDIKIKNYYEEASRALFNATLDCSSKLLEI